MPTLHARIVAAMRKDGRAVREVGPPPSTFQPEPHRAGLREYDRYGPPEQAPRPVTPPLGPPSVECSQCGSLTFHSARPDGQRSCRCGVTVQPPALPDLGVRRFGRSDMIVRLVDADYVIPDELSVDRPSPRGPR